MNIEAKPNSLLDHLEPTVAVPRLIIDGSSGRSFQSFRRGRTSLRYFGGVSTDNHRSGDSIAINFQAGYCHAHSQVSADRAQAVPAPIREIRELFYWKH